MYSKAVLKELRAMNEQARNTKQANKVNIENKIFISVAIIVMACTVINLLIYGVQSPQKGGKNAKFERYFNKLRGYVLAQPRKLL